MVVANSGIAAAVSCIAVSQLRLRVESMRRAVHQNRRAIISKHAEAALGPVWGWVALAGSLLIGITVATISAALAVKWFVAFLTKRGLTPFGYYRIALAVVILALTWG